MREEGRRPKGGTEERVRVKERRSRKWKDERGGLVHTWKRF